MATKKKMLQAAAGNAGGAAEAGLNVEDVFSTYLYEGNGGGQLIQNGIQLGQSGVGGSIEFDGASGLTFPTVGNSNFDFSAGTDFTMEAWIFPIEGRMVIVTTCGNTTNDAGIAFFTNASTFTLGAFEYVSNSVMITGTAAVPFGQWSHVAITREGTTLRLFLNGNLDQTASDNTSFNPNDGAGSVGTQSTNISLYSNGYFSDVRVVNGTAVYTANFTPPTTALTAITNTVLLIGQGDDPLTDNSSVDNTLTQIGNPTAATFGPFDSGEAGEGGLVWTKGRTQAVEPILVDTERGVKKYISTDRTSAEGTNNSILNAFNSNGFSIGGSSFVNSDGEDYASWTFRKAPKFFDVVELTVGASGTDTIIDHNLDGTVGMVITKCTSTTSGWGVFHRSAPNKYFLLNDTEAERSWTWSSTSTQINLGEFWTTTYSGEDIICYIFAHNDDDGGFGPDGDADIIKCGSYTGNGSSDGPEIDLGFEPQWLLTKNASASGNWRTVDSMRGVPTGGGTARLWPNLNLAEDPSASTNFTATGFKLTDNASEINQNSQTYVYMAIRRGLMGVPTDATEVFNVDQGANISSGDLAFDAGFPVDAFFRKDASATDDIRIMSRLTGSGKFLDTNTTDAEATTGYMSSFDNNEGITTDTTFDASDFYAWMWKRAPNFFDVVAYEGNGTAGRTVSHNLGVAPEMMWVKMRSDTGAWSVYHDFLGPTKPTYLNFNLSYEDRSSTFNNTAPTSTEFTLGTGDIVNRSNDDYIAYLFASVDGVSKVGSYTGNGTSQTIDCGFTAGARFVLTKRVDGTDGESGVGNWNFWDTERGIVAGNDPRLELNSASAQDSGHDYIDPDSSGFIVNYVADDADDSNVSGADYIFYAIA